MLSRSAILSVLILVLAPRAMYAAEPRGRAQRSTRTAEVPLKFSSSGHLEISARINGHTVSLVVDTGSPRTVLDTARSMRLGLPRGVRGQDARGLDQRAFQTELTSAQTITFGRMTCKDEQVLLLDLRTVNQDRPADGQIDGILGADFLRRHYAVIDLARMRLLLRAP